MRYVVAPVAVAVAFGVACGGGEKPADHPTNEAAPADAGQSADTGPTTTTTVLLGDGGELQGTKLTTTQAPTTIDAGATQPTPPRPNATDRDPGRTQQDLITIIHSHRDEARACYDAALQRNPGVGEGNIDITWKLDPKGTVVETGINDANSQMHDPALVKCIGDVIRKIPWAPSPRGFETNAHYPFNFHPKGAH